ncbi:MAG: DoxX family protein [Casimicrobium sp.]
MTSTTYSNSGSGLARWLHDAIGTRSDLLLRLIVGGMLIPHGIGKFLNMPKEIEVFGNVFKLTPPDVWVVAIAVFQIVAGALIVLNRFTRFAALAVVVFMLATVFVANGGNGWFWHLKGIEYSVMWALLALIVAARADR